MATIVPMGARLLFSASPKREKARPLQLESPMKMTYRVILKLNLKNQTSLRVTNRMKTRYIKEQELMLVRNWLRQASVRVPWLASLVVEIMVHLNKVAHSTKRN